MSTFRNINQFEVISLTLSGKSDHDNVTSYLWGLSDDVIHQLGEALGVKTQQLVIEPSPTLLNEVVAAWLEKESSPSWTTLVDALRKVGCYGIAVTIEQDSGMNSHVM